MFNIQYNFKKKQKKYKKTKKNLIFSMNACFREIIVKYDIACACCLGPVSPYFYYLYKAF